MKAEYPILEFDGDEEAVIEPSKHIQPVDGMPQACVMPMYFNVIEKLKAAGDLSLITSIMTSMGPLPVYRFSMRGRELAVALPGLGAALAAGLMEELIARGCRKFIACGSAGVLDSSLAKGTIVIPDCAVRDEGTSYHYAAPAREIAAQPEVVEIIESVLEGSPVPYRIGKTWTTDAFWRETRSRVGRRKAEGCLTVEMECSAFIAVAAFRGVRFGQLLSTGDDVSGDVWDSRQTGKHEAFPEKVFRLSAEACLKL